MEPQINADSRGFKYKDLTEKIIGIFYEVYNELGHGFLESVYEESLAIAFADKGLRFERQVPVPVWFRGRQVGDFRADFVIESYVLVEIKSARILDTTHEAQVLNYLRGPALEVGLLLNFGPKPHFRRLAFDNNRKNIGVIPRVSAARTS
jgi:GxxExxY protein